MPIFLLELWFFAIINARCWDVFREHEDCCVGLGLMSVKRRALRAHPHCRRRCDRSACRVTPSTSAKGPAPRPLRQPPAPLSVLGEHHPASPADLSCLPVALAVAWWQTGNEKAKWKDQTWAAVQGVWWLLPQPLWRLGKGKHPFWLFGPWVCGPGPSISVWCFTLWRNVGFVGLLCALLTVISNCSVKTHARALPLCRNRFGLVLKIMRFPAFTILCS